MALAFDWGSKLQSKTFTFAVGREGLLFYIHQDAIHKLSTYFDRLINGDMLEAKTGIVVWDDIDVQTFLLFCEFAYTGDYTINQQDITTRERWRRDLNELRDRENGLRGLQHGSRELFEQQATTHLWLGLDYIRETCHTCSTCRQGVHEFPDSLLQVLHRGTTKDLAGDYFIDFRDIDLLLAHAEIHILADRFCIDSLKDRTVHHMRWQLLNFCNDYDGGSTIATLIRYVFENTTTGDPLRDLLMVYGGCVAKRFTNHPYWMLLLSEVREFSLGILEKIAPFIETEPFQEPIQEPIQEPFRAGRF
ncbi:hypothetical protein BJ170DRAFT_697433 [Xylariales sp. AK1849]|nr:hypothetical protein BJ170DRAFT_697433 [Xylariales sp. AK1849]